MDFILIFNKIFNVIRSVFGLSLLITVHEFGHFIFCKLFKIPAPKFSIGFGPVIFKKFYKGTDFILSALPLGGFVQVGEDTNNIDESQLNILKKYSLIKGLLVLLGGIIFNFIFAYLGIIFINIFADFNGKKMILPFSTTNKICKIENFYENKKMENIFLEDDIIKSIKENKINCENDFCSFLLKVKNDEVKNTKIKLLRNKNEIEIDVYQDFNPNLIKFYPLKNNSIFEKIKNGITITNNIIIASLYSIISIFKPKNLSKVSGFLGILKIGSNASKIGFYNFLTFLSIISISLAFGNLLPIPMLDGGQIFMLIFSKIFGKFFPIFIQKILMYLSFIFIIGLTIYTTYKDILSIIF